MRRDQRLNGLQKVWWTTLGLGSGLMAGFAVSEWVGGVNRRRVRHAAARIRQPTPALLTPAAIARAVEAALHAESALVGLGVRATSGGRGTVELHGWVPTRANRALAARTARTVAGVERVVNSILVRGEDDRPASEGLDSDQPA